MNQPAIIRLVVTLILLAPLAARADYVSEVLADNPTAYYRLGESSGTTAADSSGNANHGTYDTTTALPNGLIEFGQTGALPFDPDTAVRFRGDLGTSFVDTPVVINPTAPWTIELWIKPENVGESKGIVSQNDGTGTGRALIYQSFDGSGSYFSSRFGGSDIGWGGGYITAFDTYLHLALVHDGSGGLQWYTNGIAAATGLVTPEAANGTLVIASIKNPAGQAGSGFLRGTLDEVAIYESALSAADIYRHFVAIPEPSAISLVLVALSGAAVVLRQRSRGCWR
jgi:hypothetical protein